MESRASASVSKIVAATVWEGAVYLCQHQLGVRRLKVRGNCVLGLVEFFYLAVDLSQLGALCDLGRLFRVVYFLRYALAVFTPENMWAGCDMSDSCIFARWASALYVCGSWVRTCDWLFLRQRLNRAKV